MFPAIPPILWNGVGCVAIQCGLRSVSHSFDNTQDRRFRHFRTQEFPLNNWSAEETALLTEDCRRTWQESRNDLEGSFIPLTNGEFFAATAQSLTLLGITLLKNPVAKGLFTQRTATLIVLTPLIKLFLDTVALWTCPTRWARMELALSKVLVDVISTAYQMALLANHSLRFGNWEVGLGLAPTLLATLCSQRSISGFFGRAAHYANADVYASEGEKLVRDLHQLARLQVHVQRDNHEPLQPGPLEARSLNEVHQALIDLPPFPGAAPLPPVMTELPGLVERARETNGVNEWIALQTWSQRYLAESAAVEPFAEIFQRIDNQLVNGDSTNWSRCATSIVEGRSRRRQEVLQTLLADLEEVERQHPPAQDTSLFPLLQAWKQRLRDTIAVYHEARWELLSIRKTLGFPQKNLDKLRSQGIVGVEESLTASIQLDPESFSQELVNKAKSISRAPQTIKDLEEDLGQAQWEWIVGRHELFSKFIEFSTSKQVDKAVDLRVKKTLTLQLSKLSFYVDELNQSIAELAESQRPSASDEEVFFPPWNPSQLTGVIRQAQELDKRLMKGLITIYSDSASINDDTFLELWPTIEHSLKQYYKFKSHQDLDFIQCCFRESKYTSNVNLSKELGNKIKEKHESLEINTNTNSYLIIAFMKEQIELNRKTAVNPEVEKAFGASEARVQAAHASSTEKKHLTHKWLDKLNPSLAEDAKKERDFTSALKDQLLHNTSHTQALGELRNSSLALRTHMQRLNSQRGQRMTTFAQELRDWEFHRLHTEYRELRERSSIHSNPHAAYIPTEEREALQVFIDRLWFLDAAYHLADNAGESPHALFRQVIQAHEEMTQHRMSASVDTPLNQLVSDEDLRRWATITENARERLTFLNDVLETRAVPGYPHAPETLVTELQTLAQNLVIPVGEQDLSLYDILNQFNDSRQQLMEEIAQADESRAELIQQLELHPIQRAEAAILPPPPPPLASGFLEEARQELQLHSPMDLFQHQMATTELRAQQLRESVERDLEQWEKTQKSTLSTKSVMDQIHNMQSLTQIQASIASQHAKERLSEIQNEEARIQAVLRKLKHQIEKSPSTEKKPKVEKVKPERRAAPRSTGIVIRGD